MSERRAISCFAAKSKDDAVLMASSSGGVFTELAKVIISKGGVVVGAAWSNDFRIVKHICVDSLNELQQLRGSKYVRSDITKMYALIGDHLANGNCVLFVGVPCQVAAIKKKFPLETNLICCALICHSCPDPKVWNRYVDELESNAQSKITGVEFRNKGLGWPNSLLQIQFADETKNIECELFKDPYAQAFGRGYSAGTSCLSCQFKNGNGGMDLTIGDFWGVEKISPDLVDEKGVSAIVVWTKCGQELVNHADVSKVAVTYDSIVAGNPYLVDSVHVDLRKRAIFQKGYFDDGVCAAVCKAEKVPFLLQSYLKVRRSLGNIARKLNLR